jgi:hypothetical protein
MISSQLYSTQKDIRPVYYGGVPTIVVVVQHYFIESALLGDVCCWKVFAWFVVTKISNMK